MTAVIDRPRHEIPAEDEPAMRAWYFGCLKGIDYIREAGHGFHNESLHYVDSKSLPAHLYPRIDGQFAPTDNQGNELPQGDARLTHVRGWTIVAFWDRSGDSRPNSNSAFIFDCELDGDEALDAAADIFPKLFVRFTFDVRIVETVEIL